MKERRAHQARRDGGISTLTIKATDQRMNHGAFAALSARVCLPLSGLLLLSRP